MERSVAAPERRERRSDWSINTRGSLRALWERSGRTPASWPERSSTRSWTGVDTTPASVQKCSCFSYQTLLTFPHSVFQGCREKEKSERANGQSGHPGGRVEVPEEEEEVKYLISTSSPHCLIIFKWTSPVELWITCIRLKYMEYTVESSLSWLHTMLSHILM